MSTYKVGIPHFNGKIKQMRGSGYTFERCLNDIIDNVLDKATQIDIDLTFNDKNKLISITFSDNYKNGFENIEDSNANNPLNMAHDRIGHDNDSETSEFGIGLKASAINLGEKLIIYTHVPDNEKYYHIELDFIKMANDENPNKSYEPTFYDDTISLESYLQRHKFTQGSTITIENIRDEIISFNDQTDFLNDLRKRLTCTFGRINLAISINGETIPKSVNYLENEYCRVFNKHSSIHYNPDIEPNFIMKYGKEIYSDKNGKKKTHDEIKTFISNKSTETLKFSTTFTWFNNKNQKTNEWQFGYISLFRNNRLYGDIMSRRANGSHNYTYHECNWTSKIFNKQIGLTFNKNITLDVQNDLIKCIKWLQSKHETDFTADTSTKKFKKLIDIAVMNKIYVKPEPEPESEPDSDSDSESSSESSSESDFEHEPESESQPEPQPEPKPEPEPEQQFEPQPEPKPEPEPEQQFEPQPEPKPEPEPEPEPEQQFEPEPEPQPELEYQGEELIDTARHVVGVERNNELDKKYEEVIHNTNHIQTLIAKFNISFDLLNEKIMNNIDDENKEILEIFIKKFDL
jgi:hypothetical protein